jgi:hypothetical protein
MTAVKAGIIFAAGLAFLTRRVAPILAVDGEFTFVRLQHTEDLGAGKIAGKVTSVIISMLSTRFLEETGYYAANMIQSTGVRSDGLDSRERNRTIGQDRCQHIWNH